MGQFWSISMQLKTKFYVFWAIIAIWAPIINFVCATHMFYPIGTSRVYSTNASYVRLHVIAEDSLPNAGSGMIFTEFQTALQSADSLHFLDHIVRIIHGN